jgi:hypothetical protein
LPERPHKGDDDFILGFRKFLQSHRRNDAEGGDDGVDNYGDTSHVVMSLVMTITGRFNPRGSVHSNIQHQCRPLAGQVL